LGAQRLHRFGLGKWQARSQLFSRGQRFTRVAYLALARRQFSLHKMRLGTARMGHQHLLHHHLGLFQAPGLRFVVNLLQRGLCLRHGEAKAQQGRDSQPLANALRDGSVQHRFLPLKGS